MEMKTERFRVCVFFLTRVIRFVVLTCRRHKHALFKQPRFEVWVQIPAYSDGEASKDDSCMLAIPC